MQVRVETTPLSSVRRPAAVVFAWKGKDARKTVAEAGDEFARAFDVVAAREAFTGAAGQVLVLHDRPGARIETLVVAGLGDPASAGADALRSAAAEAARASRDAGAK